MTCMLIVAIVMVARVSGSSYNKEANGRPVKPAVFNSPEELDDYMSALTDWLAAVGRPR